MSFASEHRNQNPPRELSGRELLTTTGIAALGLSGVFAGYRWYQEYKQPRARVAIYKAGSYRDSLARTIREGILNYPDVVQRARSEESY